MMLRGCFLIFLSISLIGCSHNSPRYSPSVSNQEQLKTLVAGSSNKVALDQFSASEPGKKSIVCRAEGTVIAPDGKTFEQYLQDSISSELKAVGIYSDNAEIKLKGHLNLIDFNSNIGTGKWIIKMLFTSTSENIAPFSVESVYDFPTNFVATIACEQVAQALPAATQDFVAKVIAHPSFKQAVTAKKVQ